MRAKRYQREAQLNRRVEEEYEIRKQIRDRGLRARAVGSGSDGAEGCPWAGHCFLEQTTQGPCSGSEVGGRQLVPH